LLGVGLFLGLPLAASAAPTLKAQVNQRGGFLLVGNTLGFDCSLVTETVDQTTIGPVPAPLAGVEACNSIYGQSEARYMTASAAGDTAPDLYWFIKEGVASASPSTTSELARTSALLVLPSDSRVTHAWLYWGGYLARQSGLDAFAEDKEVVFSVPNGDTFYDKTIYASQSWVTPRCAAGCENLSDQWSYYYQGVADVTGIVQGHGPGAYAVSGVRSLETIQQQNEHAASGWYLIVFYEKTAEPLVQLSLLDGLDYVAPSGEVSGIVSATLSGFVADAMAKSSFKLGVAAYEGDVLLGGDYLSFDTKLSNQLNPIDNFFNGTRSLGGLPATASGELPWLTGGPGSLSGLDLDVVDVGALITAKQTSARLSVGSSGDEVVVGALVTSLPTLVPLPVTRTKSVAPVSGTEYRRGSEVKYTITVKNAGTDAASEVAITDPLPPQLGYVPGSLVLTMAGKSTALTDQASDDAGTVTGSSVEVKLQNLPVGASVELSFRAKILADLPGCTVGQTCEVKNQAAIQMKGALGAAAASYLTDGDPGTPGDQRTVFTVIDCTKNADCAATAPICLAGSCVQCASDTDCTAAGALDCLLETHTCGCLKDCVDSDGDGLTDAREVSMGTDPRDADSDDDGVPDGAEPLPFEDSDGDGLINALDPDSDNDGLFDGTEMGRDCSSPGTDVTKRRCIPDADAGSTTTNPLARDTDGGGMSDGSEDPNLNGKIDAGETDPKNPSDDSSVIDSDGDGLSDAFEVRWRGNPNDADTDDDGVPDGDEPNPTYDTDGDGATSLLDVDSDNDGLFDGTEMGRDCNGPGTDVSKGHCRPDADRGATTTSPLLRDTDRGGMSDGSEDPNLNGRIDEGEMNPLDPSDDQYVIDSDGDGLGDALEATLGSDPFDADTDDDGLIDGLEANPSADGDLDGLISVLDPDSDDDGIFDGTELGTLCDHADTDMSKGVCVVDLDRLSVTSPILADTDGDGILDGELDANHDGRLDELEALPVASIRGGGCAFSGERVGGVSAVLLAFALSALALLRRRRRESVADDLPPS
jgi:uncharacterized repeat protein (TIGR01451 family)